MTIIYSLKISAQILAVLAASLSFFMIMRKVIENLLMAQIPRPKANADFRKLKRIASAASFRSRGKRMLAIKLLGKFRSGGTVDLLKKIIDATDDREIIYAAIQALGEIDSDASVKALVSLLGENKFSNSKIAAILDPPRKHVLSNCLERKDDADSVVRFWVANLLGNYADEIAFKSLKELTADKDPNVRAAACESFGRMGNTECLSSLYHMLDDDYWFVRLHAIKALGQFLSPESIDNIIPHLRDRNWWVRYNAKSVLKKFGQAASAHLYPVLKDDDRFARNSAVEILEETGAADMLFNKFIAHGIPDETINSYFMDFIKAEGFLWLKARLKNIGGEKRQMVVKVIEKKDRTILERQFNIGDVDGNAIPGR